jgi:PKD repeat protein
MWTWEFGDPNSGINNTSALPNPQHMFSSEGTYLVALTTENAAGCISTMTQNITITPKPAVDFTISQSCDGTPVLFAADPAITNIAGVATYLWDFGDGSFTSALAAPEHLYATAGNFVVTLTITNISGCENSISHTVTVHTLPVAQFISTGNCIATLMQFTDNSYNPDGEAIVGWAWDFGESTSPDDTSSVQNPSYAFSTPGVHNVTLTVTSETGCTGCQSA